MCQTPPSVVDLDKLFECHFKEGGQLVSYSSRYLTKPGDNYGSIMLAITARVKKSDGLIEEFSLVAKLPPITNDVYWEIFQPQRTCLTENSVYLELAPAIFQLQKELKISDAESFDCFAKCYGARISLDSKSTIVDRNAVLLLENLQTQGYKHGNRNQMFDYSHLRLILKRLAEFHALPIALKHRNEEWFNNKIRPYFRRFNLNANLDSKTLNELNEKNLIEIEIAVNGDQEILRRVREIFSVNQQFVALKEECSDGIWTTIVHCDLWINNIMIQYDESGHPVRLKFVDFQAAQYESLAHDLIFLLLSSGDTKVLEKHFHEFLALYYEHFLTYLKTMKCPTHEYSFEKLLLEVKRVMPIEISHALFMVQFILVDSDLMPKDFKDLHVEAFASGGTSEKVLKKIADIISLSRRYGYL